MKILFITHDCSLSGAPKLLFNLGLLLKEKTKHEISFLINEDRGDLKEDFENNFTTFFSRKKRNNNPLNRFVNKAYSILKIFRPVFASKKILKSIQNVDVIISNTITNGDLIAEIRKNYKGKIYTYAHELEIVSKILVKPETLAYVFRESDKVLTPTPYISDFYENTFLVNRSKLSVLPYYIPSTYCKAIQSDSQKFIIGFMGTSGWRKGFDWALQLAITAKNRGLKELRFIWQGGELSDIEKIEFNHDVFLSGCEDYFSKRNPTKDVSSFFNEINLLVLSSREDPYPMVILEAAAHQIPSICFEKGCGSIDFISTDCGSIVPYLDIDKTLEAILIYKNNPEILVQKGKNAQQKLKNSHQNEEFVLSQFHKVMAL